MPRTRTRSKRHKRYRVRAEHTRAEVEVQGVDLVGAKVDAEHVSAANVRENLMRMRSFLTRRVGPGAIADALERVGHGSDRPIGEDPINGEVAGPVIGRVEKLSRRVNADVSGELPVRRRGVEGGQVSVCRVDGIRTHAPRGIFVDGVEEGLRGVKGNERRV